MSDSLISRWISSLAKDSPGFRYSVVAQYGNIQKTFDWHHLSSANACARLLSMGGSGTQCTIIDCETGEAWDYDAQDHVNLNQDA